MSPSVSTSRPNSAPTSSGRSRLVFIDSVRGVAASLVLLQHAWEQSGFLGARIGGDFIPNLLNLGETGVVAFFLVSGFVIPLSLEKTDSFILFWVHRILRIYPLYITVFIISVITYGATLHSIGGFVIIGLSQLLFLPDYSQQEGWVGGSWTLALEMVWYVGISVLFLASFNKKPNFLVGMSVLVSVLAQTACSFGHHLPMGLLSMLVCCVLGLVCYRREQGDLSKKSFYILFTLLSLTIALNLWIGFQLFPSIHPAASYSTVMISWTVAFVIFFVPFFTQQSATWKSSVLTALGLISYSIYLLHPIVLYLLRPMHGILLIALAFSITLALSLLSYRFIELPPIRFGHSSNGEGTFRKWERLFCAVRTMERETSLTK
jgi:peptidoglycan/LPS O-acetylase OafA/YrhL